MTDKSRGTERVITCCIYFQVRVSPVVQQEQNCLSLSE